LSPLSFLATATLVSAVLLAAGPVPLLTAAVADVAAGGVEDMTMSGALMALGELASECNDFNTSFF